MEFLDAYRALLDRILAQSPLVVEENDREPIRRAQIPTEEPGRTQPGLRESLDVSCSKKRPRCSIVDHVSMSAHKAAGGHTSGLEIRCFR